MATSTLDLDATPSAPQGIFLSTLNENEKSSDSLESIELDAAREAEEMIRVSIATKQVLFSTRHFDVDAKNSLMAKVRSTLDDRTVNGGSGVIAVNEIMQQQQEQQPWSLSPPQTTPLRHPSEWFNYERLSILCQVYDAQVRTMILKHSGAGKDQLQDSEFRKRNALAQDISLLFGKSHNSEANSQLHSKGGDRIRLSDHAIKKKKAGKLKKKHKGSSKAGNGISTLRKKNMIKKPGGSGHLSHVVKKPAFLRPSNEIAASKPSSSSIREGNPAENVSRMNSGGSIVVKPKQMPVTQNPSPRKYVPMGASGNKEKASIMLKPIRIDDLSNAALFAVGAGSGSGSHASAPPIPKVIVKPAVKKTAMKQAALSFSKPGSSGLASNPIFAKPPPPPPPSTTPKMPVHQSPTIIE